jgi:hypothetical protein
MEEGQDRRPRTYDFGDVDGWRGINPAELSNVLSDITDHRRCSNLSAGTKFNSGCLSHPYKSNGI